MTILLNLNVSPPVSSSPVSSFRIPTAMVNLVLPSSTRLFTAFIIVSFSPPLTVGLEFLFQILRFPNSDRCPSSFAGLHPNSHCGDAY
ncbi:hypothetical protein CASFOL_011065 [Castilleja foliolosa]|uniref:Uncharacterized protein n=1 Tax=Castilleja foliolosa TaxID=1961234 RepID=A0ABD3DUE7_9LAMI